MNELRAGTLGGKCGRCEYRKLCGGCRARALALEGDHLAADPSCVYEPSGEVAVIERARPVTYGMRLEPGLPWSADARTRMSRIPSFVRAVVVQRVEDYARRNGIAEVTLGVLADVRRAMPVDFSKRAPFFLDREEPQ